MTALGNVAAVERAALQRQTMRVLVSALVLGGLAIGVGASVSLLLAKETTRKIKNLALDPHCSISVEWERLDLVVEGIAAKVRDAERLQRVADAYASTYDWHVTVRDGAFQGTEGAPTAGPPPYDVHEPVPTKAFGFGLDETFTPTRWRFRRG